MALIKLFVFCGLVLVAFPIFGEAHTLESKNNIGAVLHINPSEEPIVGQETVLEFSVSDQNQKFDYSDCYCMLIIEPGGVTVGQELDKDILKFKYTFAKAGTYTLSLAGQSIKDADFEPFSLKYEVKVIEQDATVQSAFQKFLSIHGLHTIIFGGGFIAVFILSLRENRKAAGRAAE